MEQFNVKCAIDTEEVVKKLVKDITNEVRSQVTNEFIEEIKNQVLEALRDDDLLMNEIQEAIDRTLDYKVGEYFRMYCNRDWRFSWNNEFAAPGKVTPADVYALIKAKIATEKPFEPGSELMEAVINSASARVSDSIIKRFARNGGYIKMFRELTASLMSKDARNGDVE